jgi:hypothetical protein
MKLQEGGCGVAGTSRDFAGIRSLGDAEQQADHQIAPEQPGELLGKFGRTAREQSGRLGLGHDFAQGGAACLASYRVERARHFGGLDRLGYRQPEYRNDRGIAYLAHELCPERSQHLRQGLAIAIIYVPVLMNTHVVAFYLLLRPQPKAVRALAGDAVAS